MGTKITQETRENRRPSTVVTDCGHETKCGSWHYRIAGNGVGQVKQRTCCACWVGKPPGGHGYSHQGPFAADGNARIGKRYTGENGDRP